MHTLHKLIMALQKENVMVRKCEGMFYNLLANISNSSYLYMKRLTRKLFHKQLPMVSDLVCFALA